MRFEEAALWSSSSQNTFSARPTTSARRRAEQMGNTSRRTAISDFLLSLPLAVRAPNGIFCCHSLPQDDQIDNFDFTIFDRPLTGPDYAQRNGPVYQLIWGRHMSPATVEKFAAKVEADVIITGHQPQETGYATNGERHLILASDHNQGVFLPIDLAEKYDLNALVARIQKFVALDV